jgi:ribonuclease HI
VFYQEQQSSPIDWLKCNTDGAYNSIIASCGGAFMNHHAEFVVAFAEKVDFQSSFIAKLCGVMRAIELANENNWLNIWIETDSNLAVLAFKANSIVP